MKIKKLTARITFNTTEEYKKKIEAFAIKNDLSMSDFMRNALNYYIKNFEKIMEEKEKC